MNEIKKLILILLKGHKEKDTSRQKFDDEKSSIVIIKRIGAKRFLKSSRKKFTEIRNESNHNVN